MAEEIKQEKKKQEKEKQEPKVMIFGSFWVIAPDGATQIHHEGLVELWKTSGFCYLNIEGKKQFVRIINNIIHKAEIKDVAHLTRKYIEEKAPYALGYGVTRNDLLNILARGIKNYIHESKLWLLPIKTITPQRDTLTESHFYFRNCIVKTSATGVTVHSYELLVAQNVYVWEEQLRPYNFTLLDESAEPGVFELFCQRSFEHHAHNIRSLQTALGYLLHRFWVPSNPVVIIFLDQHIDPQQSNGRNGKTMFGEALWYIRETVKIEGKSFNPYGTFAWQELETSTELIAIDDLNQKISFDFCYSIVTIGFKVEKKGMQRFSLPKTYSPKLAISTNHVLRAPSGSSTEGRRIEYEISNYYNLERTPISEFGHNLFIEWGEAEFNRMFNFLVRCSALYFKDGLIRPQSKNAALRQMLSEIGEDVMNFLEDKITEDVTKFNIRDTHQEFIKNNRGLQDFNRSASRFGVKMIKYFTYKGLKIINQDARWIQIEAQAKADNAENKDDEPAPRKAVSSIDNTPHDYRIVSTPQERVALLQLLASSKEFVFDTETTGLVIHTLDIKGISFCVKPHEGFYVPLPPTFDAAKEILSEFSPVFNNEDIIKIGHNLNFDIQVLRRYGIEVGGELFDTMIAHYLIAPEENHKLKVLSLNLLNYKQISFDEVAGSDGTLLHEASAQKLADYAAEDANMTYRLKLYLDHELHDKDLHKLLREIESPLVGVLADMEYEGVKVDGGILEQIREQADTDQAIVEQQIYQLAGKEFNIGSPAQVSRLLYDELGIEPIGKKGKNGTYPTGKQELKLLQGAHPVVPLILKYREVASMKSNFLAKLPNCIHPVTGRVHTSFNQAVAATGRLSSSAPNLQNIPKKSEGTGSLIRKAFVPKDDRHLLIASDYSQIELRVMAHCSNDPALVEAFRTGIDPHSVTAAKIFDVPLEQITKDDRRRKIAKTVNFGLNYGMSAKGLSLKLTAEGTPVSEAEAAQYIELYFSQFKGVKRFQEDAYFEASQKGYAQTLFGRKRLLHDINSGDYAKREAAKRQAINLPIQGTAADIIKIAMVRVHRELVKGGFQSKMLLSVHDELVFESPISEISTVMPLIKSVMEGAAELIVPLEVDIKTGSNWLEAH